MIWGFRLSAFLLFRILKTGTDTRFDDKRDKFFPFLGFWVAQMLWVWIVSLPITMLNSPAVLAFEQPKFGTGCDIAGVILFVIGFLLEAVADVQKYLFRSRPENKGHVCDVGLFAWSRHPNYFGEILLQFGMRFSSSRIIANHLGIYIIALSPSAYNFTFGGAHAAQYASILGPIFLTVLLMFVSGLNLQERPGAKRRYESGRGWTEYCRYTERTSIMLPLPPSLYVRLPTILKRTLLVEFPIYVFDPAKHSEMAKPGGVDAGERDARLEEERADA